MALTYSNVIDKGIRSYKIGDAKIAIVDVTIGATGDYSSGLTVVGSKFGMNYIGDILQGTLRASSSTHSGNLRAVWDSNSDKARVFAGTTEIAGSDIAAGDILRLTVLGN